MNELNEWNVGKLRFYERNLKKGAISGAETPPEEIIIECEKKMALTDSGVSLGDLILCERVYDRHVFFGENF